MPTRLDTILRRAAKSVVDKYGKTVTLIEVQSPQAGDYDPSTGIVAVTSTSHSVKVSPPYPVRRDLVDGKTIEADMTTILVPASGLDFEPNTSTRAIIDGKRFEAAAVLPINSGEQVAAYEIILKR